jgi:hypothetical protein
MRLELPQRHLIFEALRRSCSAHQSIDIPIVIALR